MVTMLRSGERKNVFDKSRNAGTGRRIASRDYCLLVRQILGLLIATPAVVLLLASAALAQSTPKAAPTKIKVGQIGAVSDAGIFIAQEKGFFTNEGLDVELVTFKAAPQTLPALATDEVQLSGSAVTP